MRETEIGVILPAYNEAKVIADVLRGIPEYIIVAKTEYKLMPIVVDDGSTDDTASIAKRNHRTIVIRHVVNSGAGAATRTGLRYLRENDFKYGATMDADGQHSADDLRKVLKAIIDNQADLIIGSRLINTAGMPWYKVIGNRGLNYATLILLGIKSSDSQSGLKSFNQKTIKKLSYREDGYAFCSEMLWRAKRAGLRVLDIPIQAIYTDYSTAKGQSNWSGFYTIKQLIKHRLMDIFSE